MYFHDCLNCVLQVWWRWEDDSAWSDSLLSRVETSTPTMHGVSEQQLADTLSLYQVIVSQTYCMLLPLGGRSGGAGDQGGGHGAALYSRLIQLIWTLLAGLPMLHSVHAAQRLNWLNYAQVKGLFFSQEHTVFLRLGACELLACSSCWSSSCFLLLCCVIGNVPETED